MQQRVRRSSKRATAKEWCHHGAAPRAGETEEKRQEGLTQQEQSRRDGKQQDVLDHVGAQPYVRRLVQWGDDRDAQTPQATQKSS
jgi:hypothetical protein